MHLLKQKNLARGMTVLTGAALILSFGAAPARASVTDLWHKIFPPEDTGPKPEDTLIAPFAEPDDGQGGNAAKIYNDANSNDKDLSQPHRQQAEIAEWLARAVPEIFAVEADKYDAHLTRLATGMGPAAMAQYKTFMQSSNILPSLSANHLALHAYIEEQPVVLNAMAIEGRYRWLFEMPVTLTFLTDNAKSYEQAGVTPINQHIMLRVQVGRMPAGQGMDDMIIETFEVRQNTGEQKANP